MATKLNAGDDYKRGDIFFIDPNQLFTSEKVRGRWKPPTEEAIIEMAESLFDNGQQQPIQARKIPPDHKLQINLGFTRLAAARLIRTGFVGTDGEPRHNADFKIKVLLTDANDKIAFVNNIVENQDRNPTSPVDDAFNQKRLREDMGYTNLEITKLYKWKDPNKVGRYQLLLNADDAMLEMVHDGRMAVSSALDLLELPEGERAAAIAAALKDNGKVSGTEIRAQVREHHLRDESHEHIGNNESEATGGKAAGKSTSGKSSSKSGGDSGKSTSGKSSGKANGEGGKPNTAKPLTVREIRKTFEDFEASTEHEGLKDLFKTLGMFISGRRSTKTMKEKFDKLVAE